MWGNWLQSKVLPFLPSRSQNSNAHITLWDKQAVAHKKTEAGTLTTQRERSEKDASSQRDKTQMRERERQEDTRGGRSVNRSR